MALPLVADPSAADPALADVIERVRAARAAASPLRIRGGATKDFYGQSIQGDDLDLRALGGIVDYAPSELVVTVRAGTPLRLLEAELASNGQYLAFDPPHFGLGATVGGMVAAGLAGPARAAVGGVRDYVLGAAMVDAEGALLRFGGQVMKNVAGYDVSRLLAGSLGTLGVITELSLKVLPRPPAEATLRFALGQAEALRQLNAWAGQPLPLNASCWSDAAGGSLVLRLRGARAAVQEACARLGGARADDFDWDAVREQTQPMFAVPDGQCLWRLSVPDTTGVMALPADARLAAVEWGGALRWVHAPASAAEALRPLAAGVGGHATLWRRGAGAQVQSSLPVFQPLAAPVLTIHRALKQRFDPHGLFNRGRMVAGL